MPTRSRQVRFAHPIPLTLGMGVPFFSILQSKFKVTSASAEQIHCHSKGEPHAQ